MDNRIEEVLDIYRAMIETERNSLRELPPGGRDGGQDQRLRAVGLETGQFINILARSLRRYGEAIRAKPGISSVLLPVGSGLEVSRFDRG
ncbi:hypothetical protein [Rhizobium sp. F40D2]